MHVMRNCGFQVKQAVIYTMHVMVRNVLTDFFIVLIVTRSISMLIHQSLRAWQMTFQTYYIGRLKAHKNAWARSSLTIFFGRCILVFKNIRV